MLCVLMPDKYTIIGAVAACRRDTTCWMLVAFSIVYSPGQAGDHCFLVVTICSRVCIAAGGNASTLIDLLLLCPPDAGQAPLPVVRLQGHCAPAVAVAWAFDERRLASSDCDGTVIVWKREHAVTETNDDPY